MRISDWSSDVCSSDLSLDRAGRICTLQGHHRPRRKPRPHLALVPPPPPPAAPRRRPSLLGRGRAFRCRGAYDPCAPARTRRLAAILHRGRALNRKSVVWGKGVSGLVHSGGGRIIKKKK